MAKAKIKEPEVVSPEEMSKKDSDKELLEQIKQLLINE